MHPYVDVVQGLVGEWVVCGCRKGKHWGGGRGAPLLCMGKERALPPCSAFSQSLLPSCENAVPSFRHAPTTPPRQRGVVETKVWASSGRGRERSSLSSCPLHGGGGHRSSLASRARRCGCFLLHHLPRFFKGQYKLGGWIKAGSLAACSQSHMQAQALICSF